MADTVGLIPARGGSKGLPRKNLADLGGKPLIAWTIEAALGAGTVGRVFVSTEDAEIANVAKGFGAQVIDRPVSLAGDETRTEDVIVHALQHLDQQGSVEPYFALLQPTSPLRAAAHIDQMIGDALRAGTRCAWSVTSAEHHPFKALVLRDGALEPARELSDLSAPRQSLPQAFVQNGAIYWLARDAFERAHTFFVPPVHAYEMDAEHSIDIDTASDLRRCEAIVQDQA